MQTTSLSVANVAVCLGACARYDVRNVGGVREHPANPGLKSETWGTRIWGGGGAETDGSGFRTSTGAVRV